MSDKPTLPEGPGFGLTFLYYFSGIALVTTFLAIKTLGGVWIREFPISLV
jgi:hypothetical protein